MELETGLSHMKLKDEQVEVSAGGHAGHFEENKWKEQSPALSGNIQAWFLDSRPLRLATVMLVGILLGSAITWMLMDDASNLDKDMLRGTLMSSELRAFRFYAAYAVVKMLIPYTVDKLYYLNFVIESTEEVQIDIGFSDLDFVPRKSDFIELQGGYTINTGNGAISFAAKGRATALIILEKVSDNRAQLSVGAERNKAFLFNKQLFFN